MDYGHWSKQCFAKQDPNEVSASEQAVDITWAWQELVWLADMLKVPPGQEQAM